MVEVMVWWWNVPRPWLTVLPVLASGTWKLVIMEVMVGTRNMNVRVTTT